jgi:hypothetical protein
MPWIKRPNGGWYDDSQSVPWSDMLAWEFKVFLMANHLYYHDTDYESPLDDVVYDAIVRVLEAHHAELPEWFKEAVPPGKIKAMAHAIELDEDEIKEARAWADEIKQIKGEG